MIVQIVDFFENFGSACTLSSTIIRPLGGKMAVNRHIPVSSSLAQVFTDWVDFRGGVEFDLRSDVVRATTGSNMKLAVSPTAIIEFLHFGQCC
jgi:hypothetical protein